MATRIALNLTGCFSEFLLILKAYRDLNDFLPTGNSFNDHVSFSTKEFNSEAIASFHYL